MQNKITEKQKNDLIRRGYTGRIPLDDLSFDQAREIIWNYILCKRGCSMSRGRNLPKKSLRKEKLKLDNWRARVHAK